MKSPNENDSAIPANNAPVLISMREQNSPNNNFKETSQELNINQSHLNNNNNEIQENHETQLEEINIEDQRTLASNEITEEELKKSKAILNSAICILTNFLIICFIFCLYFAFELQKEILFVKLILFHY